MVDSVAALWGDLKLGFNEWVAIGSALLALASFLLNWRVVRRQTAMQYESLKAQLDADIIAWSNGVIDLLTQAAWLAESRGVALSALEFQQNKHRTMPLLSAAVDKGRLFFPNVRADGTSAYKERAYRGGRPFLLNPIVFALYALDALDHVTQEPDLESCRYFIRCRREFVSELQQILDPRRRAEEVRRLGRARRADRLESYEDSLKLALALEARHPGLLRRRGDDGWARNVARAEAGDRAPAH